MKQQDAALKRAALRMPKAEQSQTDSEWETLETASGSSDDKESFVTAKSTISNNPASTSQEEEKEVSAVPQTTTRPTNSRALNPSAPAFQPSSISLPKEPHSTQANTRTPVNPNASPFPVAKASGYPLPIAPWLNLDNVLRGLEHIHQTEKREEGKGHEDLVIAFLNAPAEGLAESPRKPVGRKRGARGERWSRGVFDVREEKGKGVVEEEEEWTGGTVLQPLREGWSLEEVEVVAARVKMEDVMAMEAERREREKKEEAEKQGVCKRRFGLVGGAGSTRSRRSCA